MTIYLEVYLVIDAFDLGGSVAVDAFDLAVDLELDALPLFDLLEACDFECFLAALSTMC